MKEYSIKGLQQTKRQTDEEDSEGSKEEETREELQQDYTWVQQFNERNLNEMVQKLDEEKKQAQSKRNTGAITAKKNNQKIMQINYKLTQAKKVKQLTDELLQVPLQFMN